ncbi:flagellar brake protein [Lutispora thermophila]|uniref:C-di-GMP-binding flagellar brake protein YcgR, contains PilZNR and PilZ domains n=1 Tax=Lutispora thermophila DSM 19022 TaxID=1122184 RepID=A0A1M6G842_9FIRM|nr:PilZ domain-containing protein [Lutispora thermophila]SHJ06102.1 c-di-GMP-binding flagellar brake protein YcgR, contains PilZNR and PilZ domains [Lutispora thermophila DSM 19022]
MESLSKLFKVGDKVNVKVMDKSDSDTYASQVTEVLENGLIEISFPMHKSKTIYFINGEKLILIIGKKEAIYEFQAMVIEKKYENIPIMRLKVISEPVRIQRRDYYRLKITKPIKIRVINITNDSEDKFIEYKNGFLLDISEGGMMVCTKEKFEDGDFLEIIMDLEDGKVIRIKGKIVRRMYNPEKSGLYEYGIEFFDVSKKDRNQLAKFIYNEQRKLLKKEML